MSAADIRAVRTRADDANATRGPVSEVQVGRILVDVYLLCNEVDDLRAESAALRLSRAEMGDELQRLVTWRDGLPDHSAQLRHLAAALTELVHHGDLTPAGKRKLEQIIGGEA